MNVDDFLEHLRRDTERLAQVLRTGPMTSPVPACPGWTLSDLGFHVVEVLRFWRRAVLSRPQRPGEAAFEDVLDDHLADALLDARADLVAAVRDADLDARMWTWTEQDRVSFVPRRMAHEVSVHRHDAERAIGGDGGAIEAQLAWDGVDEYVMLSRASEPGPGDERVRFVAADLQRAGLITTTAGVMRFTDDDATSTVDATVTGAASDLLLLLWHRRPLDALDVQDDRGVVARLLGRADLS